MNFENKKIYVQFDDLNATQSSQTVHEHVTQSIKSQYYYSCY